MLLCVLLTILFYTISSVSVSFHFEIQTQLVFVFCVVFFSFYIYINETLRPAFKNLNTIVSPSLSVAVVVVVVCCCLSVFPL